MAYYRKKTWLSAILSFFLLSIFSLYLIVLFYITFFAWNYGSSFGPVGPGGRNYNMTPFLSIYRIAVYSRDWMDPFRILVGNVLLFMPFGLLFPLVLERFFKMSVVIIVFLTLLMAMLLSTFIEVNQFLFTYRVANIDDVILNTVGGFLGIIIYLMVRNKRWIRT